MNNIKDKILELENFDFENFDNDRYRFYKQKFAELLNGNIEIPTMESNPRNQVFSRCRINENGKLFKNLKELWYPPKEKTSFGRFNFRKDPLLYCAQDAATAILEVNPNKNDIVTILEFKINIDNFTALVLGVEHYDKAKFQFKDQTAKSIYEFLVKQCKKKVNYGRYQEYCPTILFAKSISLSNFDCYMYESVSAKYSGVNFAFKPEFIDKYFLFHSARVVHILETLKDDNYSIRCLFRADYLENGLFHWKEIECKGHDIDISGNIIHN